MHDSLLLDARGVTSVVSQIEQGSIKRFLASRDRLIQRRQCPDGLHILGCHFNLLSESLVGKPAAPVEAFDPARTYSSPSFSSSISSYITVEWLSQAESQVPLLSARLDVYQFHLDFGAEYLHPCMPRLLSHELQFSPRSLQPR